MSDSRLPVHGAIAANVAIAVTKFIVAGITGSSAMLAEGIHSAVDIFNGGLLLLGQHRSRRPATPEHPFGHGKELFFWSLIVGVLVFGLGGGVSFVQGLQHVRHPVEMTDVHWNYLVLAAAALFEGGSFAIALRAFLREKGDTPFWKALHRSKDPSTYTVMAEDGAALVGLAIAAVGIFLSDRLQAPVFDGIASMAIGVLLAVVACALIHESRSLLVGEGVQPETAQAIRDLALAQPHVKEAGRVLSMYVGPDDVLVTMDLDFEDATPAADAGRTIATIERQVRERFPSIRRVFIEAGSAPPDHRWTRPDAAAPREPVSGDVA
jgi:cation diffusion facilitator family transporter